MNATEHLVSALADRYRIERALGAGGMATVYLAHDVKHDRPVALKVLHPSSEDVHAAERFHREIRALARLRHPFILPLLDSGEVAGALYYVMPVVDGGSLRARLETDGPLPARDALEIARQVADALQGAHDEGIVHRDVKPENILIARSGHALLADFGIARLVATADGDRVTRAGLSIGTAAYMSPEQALGERDLDARSDVYALACVTFEMLAGRPPFEGGGTMATLARMLSVTAPDVRSLRGDAPPSVAMAIARALAKSPEERPASAAEFARALAVTNEPRSSPVLVTHTAAAARLSLAVLPIAHIGAPDDAWFADGLTEELTGALARIEGLRVVSRTSVMASREQAMTAHDVGARLGVEFLLEGSVRRAAQRIRMAMTLVSVSDDAPLWSATYDRTLDDVFAVQDEVTANVVDTITRTLQLGHLRGRVPMAAPASMQAYDLYLLGRHHWYERTETGMRRARELFTQAVEMDPGFALAWSGLADASALLASWQFADAAEMFPGAVAAAERALALDPTLSEAHASIGFVKFNWEWDWAGALTSLRRAIELNPNNETAHRWLSAFLSGIGREREARPIAERALLLNPLSPLPYMNLGMIGFLHDRGDEAIRNFELALELQPNLQRAQLFIAAALTDVGRADEAIPPLRKLVAESKGLSVATWSLGMALALSGKREEAATVFEPVLESQFPPMYRAMAYGVLGHEERMFALLEQAIAVRSDWMYSLEYQPWLRPWRSDPRFRRVVAMLKLPDANEAVTG